MHMRLYLLTLSLLMAIAFGLINPKQQPGHLYERFRAVIACRVTAIDAAALTVTLTVEKAAKGPFAATSVVITAAKADLLEELMSLSTGQLVVAFVGKNGPASIRNDILYYVGGGKWLKAVVKQDADPARWELLSSADADQPGTSDQLMFGTFNGRVESLWRMMEDTAEGRAYFPAIPTSRFRAVPIGAFPKPIHGVGIRDVDGDGRDDLFACSDGGCRLYIQTGAETFADRTAEFGLAGIPARSCSFADVDADGKVDLLLDGRILLGDGQRFTASDVMPAEARDNLLSSAFVDIDGDGYPDVVVSKAAGGLHVYLNPGPKGGVFSDATHALGLNRPECGAGKTGYFEAGDLDGNGRQALIYLAGPGYVLRRGEAGGFIPGPLGGDGGDGGELDGGTAACGAVVQADRPSLFLVHGSEKRLMEEVDGRLMDVTRYGNELQDSAAGLSMCVAEDLNADGTMDLYATGSHPGMGSIYFENRGYGSFTLPEKYRGGKVVPTVVCGSGAVGLAVGDVTGDGANDLLVGMVDGDLILLVNETLSDRKPQVDESTGNDERKQIQTRILRVKPVGPAGVTGCRITLTDERNRVVASRQVGTNVGIGCGGPDEVNIAVREPGAYLLAIRFTDGHVATREVVLTEAGERVQPVVMTRGHGPRASP